MRTEDEIRADAADQPPFSNGTEWDMWATRHCYECVHDNPNADPEVFCPIITVALVGKGNGPMWPTEWTRRYVRFGARIEGTDRVEVSDTTADDPDGCLFVGTCTEFEERRDDGPGDKPEPVPPPEVNGQLDLIDAYLDTAIGELTKAPAVVR